MKRIVFIIGMLFVISTAMYSQQYQLSIVSEAGGGYSYDECRISGITLTIYTSHQSPGGSGGASYTGNNRLGPNNFEHTGVFSQDNPIVRVTTRNVGNYPRVSCISTDLDPYDITLPCTTITRSNPYANLVDDRLSIIVHPIVNLGFEDGTGVTEINYGCSSDSFGIDATAGFVGPDQVYSWEFFNNITSSGSWEPIPNHTGDSSIDLSLEDLFANSTDRQRAVGQNILIRINPCNDSDTDASNVLTVNYMPSGPDFANPAYEVEESTCGVSDDAGFTLFFDRQLTANEEININLINDDNNRPLGSNNGIARLTSEGGGVYSYTWTRPSGGSAIGPGNYRVEVRGFISGSNASLTCDKPPLTFSIEEAIPISFTVEPSRPACETSSSGRAVITSLDGGSGEYQYRASNGSWITITSLPREITGLSAGNNTIRIRDRNAIACESERIIQIQGATRTVLNDVEFLPPATANMDTGYLEIGSITGDIPFEDSSGAQYYLMDETVFNLDNGEVDIESSGIRVPVRNITRNNLIEGQYSYRIYGQSGCSVTLDFTLRAPDPISFSESDIQKQDPSCSSSEDGRLTLADDDISGGTPPYSIAWSAQGSSIIIDGNSITGGDTVYQVLVTDDRGIEAELRGITFDNVPLPVLMTEVNIQPIACYGENATVTITAEGGSGSYQYAIWTGVSTTTWQNSNVFALPANSSTGYRFRVRDRNVSVCTSEISSVYTIAQPDDIDITPQTVIDNTVFEEANGSITINVTGGTSPYTIRWQREGTPPANAGTGTTINNLIAGRYIATATDANGCIQESDPIEITEPDELLVSINAPAIICNAGIISITAEAVGGSETYTYQWYRNGTTMTDENDPELSTGAGRYYVQVDDGYTTARSAELVILEPEALGLSLSKTDISCYGENDGTITLNPSGGTRPYYFSIDNRASYIIESDLTDLTLSNLEPETYEIWIRDVNGCEIATPQTITIDEPTEIIITPVAITNATTVDGTNGAIDIDIEGGVAPFTYAWSKIEDASFNATTQDITGISAGTYIVLATDNTGCEMDGRFEVIEPDSIEVTITLTNPILCYGDALGALQATVTGGYPITGATPADYTYQWYAIEEGIEVPINTDLTQTSIDELAAGIYSVVATDSQGASDDSIFEIMQPDDLTVVLSETPTNVNCYGEATGSIDVTVTGGPRDETTGAYLPYTYRWTKVEEADFLETTEDLVNITAGTYELVVIDDNLCTTSLSEAVVITEPDAPLEIYDIITVNLTGFETRNGSISLEVSGGVLPYRHAWTGINGTIYSSSSQDISGIPAGEYELVVTDANDCTISITQEITQPEPLVVTINPLLPEEGVQCFGEETVLPLSTTTTGGVPPYTYEWYQVGGGADPIFTGPQTMTTVAAGTYIAVVTDSNGNTDTTFYEVTQPEILEISHTVTHLLCRGEETGSIDITVVGGVLPYSYRWSNGDRTEDVNSLGAGNYTVTVTDANGCVIRATVEVEQPPGLFVSGDIVRLYPSVSGANDGSITVTIGGGTPPYQYEWRNFSNEIQSSRTNVLENIGIEGYSLTVTDANGCILEIENVDLFEPPPLEVTIEQVNVVSCFGNEDASLSAIAEGGAPFNASKQYIYQWFDADTNTQVGTDWFLLENRGTGSYYVIVQDAVGTTATSDTFQLGEPDLLELSLDADFVFCGDGADWTVIPQVAGGTSPYTYQWSNGSTSEHLENVIAGTYDLEVTDARGCQVTHQITLVVPDALTTTPSLTIPTCYGGCDGIIALETAGGTPPYTYLWNTGETSDTLTNICAATYTVVVTDSKACQITREIILENPEQLVVDLGEDITLCLDQSIVLDATIEDEGATYQWTSQNGFRSSEPIIEVWESDIYEVLVTDTDGCIATDSIFIDTTTDTIGAQFIASTQVFVGEEFVLVENSDPFPDAVEWIFPEDAIVTFEDDNYAEAIFETPGEYEVTLQTYRGLCTASITKRVVVVEQEIETENGDGNGDSDIVQSYIDYTAYPNPSPTGSFTVDVALSSVQPINVKVFTMTDNRVLDSRSAEGSDTYIFEYNMQYLASGVYFILLETATASQVRKLIIE